MTEKLTLKKIIKNILIVSDTLFPPFGFIFYHIFSDYTTQKVFLLKKTGEKFGKNAKKSKKGIKTVFTFSKKSGKIIVSKLKKGDYI